MTEATEAATPSAGGRSHPWLSDALERTGDAFLHEIRQLKRLPSAGWQFAGIPNPLFAADNCLMLFGDGKKALNEVVAALKEG